MQSSFDTWLRRKNGGRIWPHLCHRPSRPGDNGTLQRGERSNGGLPQTGTGCAYNRNPPGSCNKFSTAHGDKKHILRTLLSDRDCCVGSYTRGPLFGPRVLGIQTSQTCPKLDIPCLLRNPTLAMKLAVEIEASDSCLQAAGLPTAIRHCHRCRQRWGSGFRI